MTKLPLIAGLGKTGCALLEYFAKRHQAVLAFDEQDSPANRTLEKKYPSAHFFFGGLPDEVLGEISHALISPGIPPTQSWLDRIRENKIPISGEFELATSLLSGKFLAVTGTNGKSTTVTLLHDILTKAGLSAALKGNIGDPLISAVDEPARDFYVLEVSSYQLETIDKFHPWISVLLNVSDDHLDRYASKQDYAQAKARIFKNQTAQDFFIVNDDDLLCKKMAKQSPAHVIPFSLVNEFSEGGFISKNEIVIRLNGREDRYDLQQSALIGLHNQENQLAAILAATLAGVQPAIITRTLKEFKSLPHRLELVGDFEGIRFFDDSKGTNVASVVMSLASFEQNVFLILGGRDKGGDYKPLCDLIRAKTKAVLTIGEAGDLIADKLAGCGEVVRSGTMKEALKKIKESAQKGDVVLLSPACSSFDQYVNYHERGEDFKRWALHFFGGVR